MGWGRLVLLSLGALGTIYGDIGKIEDTTNATLTLLF